MSSKRVEFVLPWPPSVNHYWRIVRGRPIVSREGREYRERVASVVDGMKGFGRSRVAVEIVAEPPDRRKRDLDNILKATLDAMTSSGMWDDDSHVDEIVVKRGLVRQFGRLVVTVEEITDED